MDRLANTEANATSAELENRTLRAELEEAREILAAIRTGAVDALVVDTQNGLQVYTLQGAERVYRTLIERMQEGAVIVSADGVVEYCNQRFADFVGRPLELVIGQRLVDWIEPKDHDTVIALLSGNVDRQEITLLAPDGAPTPTLISTVERPDAVVGRCLVVTDLSDRKLYEAGILRLNALLENRVAERTAELETANSELKAQVAERQRVEAELRAMFNNSSVGIVQVDPAALRFVQINPAFCAMTGYAEHELMQLTVADITHPDHRERDRAGLALLATGERSTHDVEKRYCRKDGVAIWTHVTVNLIRDAAGRPYRNIAIIQDITERKTAEATLRAFYDVSPVLMGTVELAHDGDMVRLYSNPASKRFFGTGHQLSSSAKSSGVTEQMLAQWRANYQRAAHTGAPVSFEYTHLSNEADDERLLSVTLAPLSLRGPAGHPTFCYVATEITDARRAELTLREADRRKDEFLAVLSHELRNPLAPIRTAAHVLGSSKLAPAQLLWAQNVIQRQVHHMASLLDDLLDVARITQGKLELKRARVTLSSIVDSAVEAARPLIDRKHHNLEVALPDPTLTLYVDPLRLSQILSNLLTNAAKYTDPGGLITLSSGLENHFLRLSVKDNGIGLPAEFRRNIFTMFSQVDGTAGRSEGGLGIGLALIKGLTDLHGGSIEANSEGKGRGSEFTIRIPLKADATPVDPATEPVNDPPSRAMRRVLIADDNRDAADSLAMMLELAGYEVRVAHTGHAALSIAQTFNPQVGVLDIGIPDLNGYDIARTLRKRLGGPELCLIALTGWGQDRDKEKARDAGFNHHLTKPVDPDVLEALVRG